MGKVRKLLGLGLGGVILWRLKSAAGRNGVSAAQKPSQPTPRAAPEIPNEPVIQPLAPRQPSRVVVDEVVSAPDASFVTVGRSGVVTGLRSDVDRSGYFELRGHINRPSGQNICGKELTGLYFQTGQPAPNPVQGTVHLVLAGAVGPQDLKSITIAGVTLRGADANLQGRDKRLVWGNNFMTQAERTAIYRVLSGGKNFTVSFTCN